MGNQTDQLNAAKEDLQQIHTQIADLHMDEQQTQAFEQTQEEIRRQLASDQGAFAAKNEMELLALTKVKLEQDIEEITRLIQAENEAAVVTQSARQIQEPVEVPPEENLSILGRIARFFKSKSKKENAPYPWYTKSQRKALMKREKKIDDRYRQGRQENPEIVMEMLALGEKPNMMYNEKCITENYEEYYNMYAQSEWKYKNNSYDDKTPEELAKIKKSELKSFFRELGNPGCFDEIEDGTFQLDVYEYSREDLRFLLSHANEEGLRRIHKQLFEFDIKKALKECPLHKMKTKEARADLLRKWYDKYHRVLGVIQFTEKFGMEKMSPEYEKEFKYRAAVFNQFTAYMTNGLVPTNHCTEEIADSILEMLPMMREQIDDEEEMVAIHNEIVRDHKPLQFQGEEPKELFQELQKARLVTEDGRIRLNGMEPQEQIRKFGREDLTFYKRMKDIAIWLQGRPSEELDGISEGELRAYQDEYHALFSALGERLQGAGGGMSYTIRSELRNGFGGEGGYLNKLFSHMEEYEEKKKGA